MVSAEQAANVASTFDRPALPCFSFTLSSRTYLVPAALAINPAQHPRFNRASYPVSRSRI